MSQCQTLLLAKVLHLKSSPPTGCIRCVEAHSAGFTLHRQLSGPEYLRSGSAQPQIGIGQDFPTG